MFNNKIGKLRIYRITMVNVIEKLSKLSNVLHENFIQKVKESFEGYEYEDIEDLIGFDTWPDISLDGDHELHIKINHEDAYDFTIHINTKNHYVNVINVL